MGFRQVLGILKNTIKNVIGSCFSDFLKKSQDLLLWNSHSSEYISRKHRAMRSFLPMWSHCCDTTIPQKKTRRLEKSKTRESPISIYPLRLAAHAILLLVEGLLPYFLLPYSERRKCLWKAFLETGAAMGTFHNAENFLSIEDHHCRWR